MKAFSFYNQKENYKVVDVVLVHPLNFEVSYTNKIIKKLHDIEIPIVCFEDLIMMKQKSGRNQDLNDIEMLKKVKILSEKKNE